MRDVQFDELLTLTAPPPDDLLERVRARRAAGERVLLPTVPGAAAPAAAAPAARARRSWRWAAAPAGIAAVSLVAVLGERGGGPTAPPAAGPGRAAAPAPASPAVPADAPLPGSPAAAPHAPAPRRPAPPRPRAPERLRSAPLAPAEAPAGARTAVRTEAPTEAGAPAPAQPARTAAPAGAAAAGAPFALRARGGTFALGLRDVPGAPDAAQRPMLDSLARVLAREPARRAVVRYVDLTFTRESASWRLAGRVVDYLLARGVAAERMTLARVPLVPAVAGGAGDDAVEVVVAAP